MHKNFVKKHILIHLINDHHDRLLPEFSVLSILQRMTKFDNTVLVLAFSW